MNANELREWLESHDEIMSFTDFESTFDEDHEFQTTGVVAVPVRIERTGCGVLELLNRSDGKAYTERNMQMLEIFARYTSISIENLLDAQRATEMARRDDLTGRAAADRGESQLGEHLRIVSEGNSTVEQSLSG